MQRMIWKHISIGLIAVLFGNLACVTVKVGGPESKRATGVTAKAPGSPFIVDDAVGVDASWKNPTNGNAISYLTDCQDPSDPPLDGIVQGVLTGLSDLKTEATGSPTIQGREGRRVLASGKVDGVPSQIDLLVFKRNQCIYVLTYAGVLSVFDKNRRDFNQFIEEFRAP